ncbi:dTDP-4-dehydrorhamnose reductase [Paenibacillus sp. GCM10027627]|uniref:dTDP-4-dehydrorhamnose reductase n=1 Tax=unclassified Paenibacillus TaxID=185978 RepID=UPI00363FDD04
MLIGKNGQVGWELNKGLLLANELISVSREQLDLKDEQETRAFIRSVNPQLIINATAFNGVELAEKDSKEADWINGTIPGILAEEALNQKAAFIHFSTDYVFDGTKSSPYTEEDMPNPINAYGKSKLQGETNIKQVGGSYMIFRTSWAYGLRGKNFLLTILDLVRNHQEVKVVTDQRGAPTWCSDISNAILDILDLGKSDMNSFFKQHSGLYHLTSQGSTTWFEFAHTFIDLYMKHTGETIPQVIPISSKDYHAIAKRPQNSILSNQKINDTFNVHLNDWKYSLNQVISRIGENQHG